jgi:hypothetical protein
LIFFDRGKAPFVAGLKVSGKAGFYDFLGIRVADEILHPALYGMSTMGEKKREFPAKRELQAREHNANRR